MECGLLPLNLPEDEPTVDFWKVLSWRRKGELEFIVSAKEICANVVIMMRSLQETLPRH